VDGLRAGLNNQAGNVRRVELQVDRDGINYQSGHNRTVNMTGYGLVSALRVSDAEIGGEYPDFVLRLAMGQLPQNTSEARVRDTKFTDGIMATRYGNFTTPGEVGDGFAKALRDSKCTVVSVPLYKVGESTGIEVVASNARTGFDLVGPNLNASNAVAAAMWNCVLPIFSGMFVGSSNQVGNNPGSDDNNIQYLLGGVAGAVFLVAAGYAVYKQCAKKEMPQENKNAQENKNEHPIDDLYGDEHVAQVPAFGGVQDNKGAAAFSTPAGSREQSEVKEEEVLPNSVHADDNVGAADNEEPFIV